MEDGERRPQTYSEEYDWLVPDLTWNNRGQYIQIFMEVLINLIRMAHTSGPNPVSHYLPLEWRLIKYVYYLIFSTSMRQPPPMIRGI